MFVGCSDRKEILEQIDIDETIRSIAEQYITAEYKGDAETLNLITKEAAAEAVKSGELGIFKSHKLNEIRSYSFIKTNDPDQRLVIATINSATGKDTAATDYYEHLYFKKFGDKWYIVKVERDA